MATEPDQFNCPKCGRIFAVAVDEVWPWTVAGRFACAEPCAERYYHQMQDFNKQRLLA